MQDKYLNDILAKQAYIQQNMPKKDPFDKGIMRAIKSAKQSLDMDEEQDDKAMRNSMLTFGEEMHKMPKTRGFIGNLAQVGRAMGPALKTHDAYEDQAKNENKAMLQYAQQLRAAEEVKMANLEQQAYLREHADQQLAHQREQLARQKEHDNLMAQIAGAKAYAKEIEKEDKNPIKDIYGKPYHKLDIVESRNMEKLKTGLTNTKLGFDNAKETGKELSESTKKNTFLPIGGFMTRVANPVKDSAGLLFNNKKLQDETALRNSFKAQLGNITVMLEVAKTNKALTQGMYDRLRENFPNVDKDSIRTIEEKMRFLTKEIDQYDKASRLSVKYGVKIDPADVDNFEAHVKANESTANEVVTMKGPEGTLTIPKNDINAILDAQTEGFEIIER